MSDPVMVLRNTAVEGVSFCNLRIRAAPPNIVFVEVQLVRRHRCCLALSVLR